ncbi:MAG: NAD-dependent epimerase/dehydratase family protein [Candidatus Promineifilaceae bacterium]|nr:NAD-dependent epimerase/dehydratase family protein [Candidatus Promineifilaceae bacterium]
MKILILGGTVFLGRHLVEAAHERGHDVTLFNRGRSNPDLFSELEQLRGDRDGDLSALDDRQWDAVIDTSGYLPRVVTASAKRLADATSHYTFISSVAVYDDRTQSGMDESGAVGRLEDPTVEEITGETYGPLKVLCEEAVQEVYSERALIIRPGLIVGPHDPSDRFTYWPLRVARGGDVLAPGSAAHPIQFIDVRDLALWTIRMVEEGASGVYNATGETLRMGDLLEACRVVSGATARFRWVDEAFLLEHRVQPWSEIPLWLPGEAGAGMGTIDVTRAVESGLRFRPMEETVEDTLAWASERGGDYELRAGLSPEREADLLQEWFEEQAEEMADGPDLDQYDYGA